MYYVFPSFGPQFNGIFNLTFRDILYIKGWPLLGIKLSSGFPANENWCLSIYDYYLTCNTQPDVMLLQSHLSPQPARMPHEDKMMGTRRLCEAVPCLQQYYGLHICRVMIELVRIDK